MTILLRVVVVNIAIALASLWMSIHCAVAEPITVGGDPIGARDGFDDAEVPEEFEEVDVAVPLTDESKTWFGAQYARVERVFNHMLGQTTRRGTILFIVAHRASSSLDDEPLMNFFGFDQGNLKVALGLRYGIFDFLDVGILRTNNAGDRFDTYDLDVRVHLLRQKLHYVDMAVRAGVTFFVQNDAEDATGVFGQLLVSRQFMNRFLAGTGVLFHNDSTNGGKRDDEDDSTAALLLAGEARVLGWLSVGGEVTAAILGFTRGDPAYTVGVKLHTHRHTFSIVVSNSQFMGADGIADTVTGSDFFLGFNIIRGL